NTLNNYRRSYAPPKEMGQLGFSNLEVRTIESNSVFVLGNWKLTMKDTTTREGNFSLIIKRLNNSWKIIHDHTSLKSR
ncbi:MAG: DUF4440 domain-containing protein, partial [Planctomycetota bacterium]